MLYPEGQRLSAAGVHIKGVDRFGFCAGPQGSTGRVG